MQVRERPRYWQKAASAESGLRSDLAPGFGVHGSLGHSPVAGHPTTQHSPLSHSTTGTPVQSNWTGDDWRSDFNEANHDAYFAPAYYETPRPGSSRESVLMQGVDVVNAFGGGFSNQAREMVHEIARHPVQSTVNVLKGLASLGEAAYDLDNQMLHFMGLPHSVSAAGQASRIEMGAWHALRSEVSQFETGTAVQKAAMLGSAALFVAESFGAGGAISTAGRLALSASGLGRVGLFGRQAIEVKPLFKTGGISAEEANTPFIEAEKRPPYTAGSRARIIQLEDSKSSFVRVHGENNQVRAWLMRAKEIEGLTPEEIKDKFALPELPKYISKVYLPDKFYLQLGRTASQEGWGGGGAIQYQALERLDRSWFSEPKLIEEYRSKNRFSIGGN